MVESIGEKLRLARETRGIALRDISEQTRISKRYLEAIETDDYRRLPRGDFKRTLIRAFEKKGGLGEEQGGLEKCQIIGGQGENEEEGDNAKATGLNADEG